MTEKPAHSYPDVWIDSPYLFKKMRAIEVFEK